jgi:hypothetical protein
VDTLQTLLIERDCTRLICEYANFVDFDEPEKAALLFTDDGSLILRNRGKVLKGRAEFGELYKNQRAGQAKGKLLQRHVCSQIMIDVKDADHATGQTRVLLYRAEWDVNEGPCPNAHPALFVWDNEFVRTKEGWKIFTHSVSALSFESPEAKFSTPWGR